jgi:DNA-binding beta-propeller fold protein YncE
MKKYHHVLGAIFLLFFALRALCATTEPLTLIGKYELPSEIKGGFDHLIVDLKSHRLFATLIQSKSVVVIDIKTGKLIKTIGGFEDPHSLLYRQDLERLYVADGEPGELKIFDGETYDLIKSVKLIIDTDAIAYDPATKNVYVVTGGEKANSTYSVISIIDTTNGDKVGDINVESGALEAMALETSSPKMYVNNRSKNQVEVIDRKTRQVLASWPLTLGKGIDPIALDEANHRLYVACRSGQIVVFDTITGKELQALPIGGGVDDLFFDSASKRLYATCGAAATVDVYKEIDADHYVSLGKVPSAARGRTGRLVPELSRFFVAVPQHEDQNAEILVYQVN